MDTVFVEGLRIIERHYFIIADRNEIVPLSHVLLRSFQPNLFRGFVYESRCNYGTPVWAQNKRRRRRDPARTHNTIISGRRQTRRMPVRHASGHVHILQPRKQQTIAWYQRKRSHFRMKFSLKCSFAEMTDWRLLFSSKFFIVSHGWVVRHRGVAWAVPFMGMSAVISRSCCMGSTSIQS